jgi:hypothetical protein
MSDQIAVGTGRGRSSLAGWRCSVFVALTGGTHAHVVLDHGTQVGGVEVAVKSVKGALNTLMSIIVDGCQDLMQQRGA